ncbi:putative ribonuclease H-like domain-containing protein [Tanacetum coccineum]
MEAGTTTTLTAKLPILNPADYDLWLTRIEKYFLMTDYSLWEVIKNGNKVLKRTVGTVKQEYEPTTTEEKQDRRNEMKARGTLLMAFPNKDQLKFHSYQDAKLLMEAIEKRKLVINGQRVGFDRSKVECYNCHKNGHFIRECRALRNQEYRGREKDKRTFTVETPTQNAFIAQDGIGGYDWSYQAKEEHITNFALMAYTSSGCSSSLDSEVDSYSKTCLESVEARLAHYKKNEAVFEESINVLKLEVRLRDNALVEYKKKLEKAEKERDELKLTLEKFQNSSKSLNNLLESQVSDKFKTGLGYNAASSTAASPAVESFVNSSEMLENQEYNKSKSDKGYHAVPPPYTGNFIPSKPDLMFMDEIVKSENMDVITVITLSNGKKIDSNHESNSDDESEAEPNDKVKTVRPSTEKIKSVKTVIETEEPKQNKYYPRGNQRNWNNLMSQRLGSDFKMINKACFVCGSFEHLHYVCDKKVARPVWNNSSRVNHKNFANKMTHPYPKRSFVPQIVLTRYSANKNNIVNKNVNTARVNDTTARDRAVQKEYKEKGVIDSGCSRHMAGNKYYLTEYEDYDGGFVSFGDGKGRIYGKVLLRVPRKDNIYSVDLKRVVPTVGLTCLFAKATIDESNVFFLATKDETSGILKTFITRIENQLDYKVKVIRCDNGTKFKNSIMNQFCKMKGIKREFSVARIPQQNGVAERKNRTLIEAARTMLVDSKLPTTFWAEAVNTACYVLYKVLVIKPHNKTPYELIRGRPPLIDFIKPFRCPITILNTRDHLGEFDGKADERFLVGHFVVSKAIRVFNRRTRIVEETLNIRFLENAPNVKGNRPDWLFDVDSLIMSMNYVPVVAGNQTNGIAGTKDNIVTDPKDSEENAGKKPTEVDENEALDNDGQDDQATRSDTAGPSFTDNVPSSPVNTAGPPDNVEEEVDMNIMVSSYTVLDAPAIKFLKDHPQDQVIGSLKTPVQTRHITKINKEHVWTLVDLPRDKWAIGTKWVFRNKKDERGIVVKNKARLVAQGHTQKEVHQMDVKSAFLYGKIEEEVYVCQPPSFEDPHFQDKVYKVYVDDIIFGSTKKEMSTEFEKLMHDKFQISSMGELSFFLGLKVQQKSAGIFISQDKYVAEILKKFDFASVKTASTLMKTNKALIKDEEAEDVDVHLYRSMIRSLMYLTASRPYIMFAVYACTRFQVTPKTLHLYVVRRIFRYLKGQPKLGLWYIRDSPFNLEAFSDSDYAGASLDRKSTTGGCQFLGKRLISWQCKKQTIIANSTTEAEYVAATNCCGKALWIQNQMLDYGFNFMNTKIYIDNESTICIVKNLVFHSKTKHIEIRHYFIRDSYEKKLIQVIKIHTDLNVADLLTKAFDVNRGRDTKIPQSGGPPKKVGDEAVHKELGDRMESAATTASSLEADTSENGEMEITATIDGRVKTVTEASIRRHLKLEDSDGIPTLPNAKFFKQLALMGYGQNLQGKGSTIPVETHHTPTSALSTSQPPTTPPSMQTTHDAEEPATMPHDLPLPRVQSLGSIKGSLTLNELTVLCTTLSKTVEDFQSDLKQTKLTYGAVYTKLIMRVKKLEHKGKTSADIKILLDQEELTKLVEDLGSGEKGEKEISTHNVPVSTASAIPKVSTAILERQVYIRRSATKRKDKGKAIMTESEPEQATTKLEEQEKYDLEQALELQKQLDKRKEVIAETTQAHDIDWSDPIMIRYHALQNRSFSVAEVRKNMSWDQNHAFVPKDSEIKKEVIKRPGFDLQQKQLAKEEKEKKDDDSQQQAEGSRKKTLARKRAGEKKREESAKRQKMKDNTEKEDLKEYLNIVPEEGMTVETLQTKHPIIDWENFDKDDLLKLWELVKERFSSIECSNDKERELWVELSRLFEPNTDDRLELQRHMHDLLTWRLYDSCGVHHVSTKTGLDLFMLIDKDYPLTRGLPMLMLVNKLQVDHDSEMANKHLRKIFILANRPRQ